MKDLRQGRLDVTPHYVKVDLPFFRENLQAFVPDKVIDIHAHVGNKRLEDYSDFVPKSWAQRVTMGCEMPVPNLIDAYMKLLPGKDVSLVCFGHPARDNVDRGNAYLAGEMSKYPNVWGFGLTIPEWDQDELYDRMSKGGFYGLKSYLNMVSGKAPEDVTILDIFPHHQLELAEEKGWIVMLHVPRAGRLADKSNIEQLHEICAKYPQLKLVIAHVGRAYSDEVAREGLYALKDLDMLYYDISANTCQTAFENVIEIAGPKHILYGSDMPIFAMRGKRVVENGNYINYVYKADWEDEHTRRCPEEEDKYTFMLYEELIAFKKASEKYGLGAGDLENVFYNNARNLLP